MNEKTLISLISLSYSNVYIDKYCVANNVQTIRASYNKKESKPAFNPWDFSLFLTYNH